MHLAISWMLVIISYVLVSAAPSLKNIPLFAAAAILSHQALQTTYRIHAHLYNSSIVPSFAK
jgi:hypothetical protein